MTRQIIDVTQPELPKGGGAISGIGETFQPHEFTGTAALTIPIPTTPARGFEPKLSVDYNSAAGNGLFGLGWSLSLPNIARKGTNGLPKYDGSDTFILSNADELTQVVENGRRTVTIDQLTYRVITYRPRREALFARIERWLVPHSGDSYWRVISKDNVTTIFGAAPQARICDPDDPRRVFQWLLQETYDGKGNLALYEYGPQANSAAGDNPILQRIKYGNSPAMNATQWRIRETINYGTEPALKSDEWQQQAQNRAVDNDLPKITFHMQLVFDYSEPPIDPDKHALYEVADHTWLDAREDPFSSFHAGFEICTSHLCRSISMFHAFPAELGAELVLTHVTRFDYRYHEHAGLALLESVQSIGYRFDPLTGYKSAKMPALTFEYTPFDPSQTKFEPFLTGQQFQTGVESSRYQLLDLYGEGAPGILYADGTSTLYWAPEGSNGGNRQAGTAVHYAPPRQPDAFPIHRQPGTSEQRLLDLTGNGMLELVVETPVGPGYYQIEAGEQWQSFQALRQAPLSYSDPNGQLIDLSGDGLLDLVRIEQERVCVYPGLGRDGFAAAQERVRRPDLPWPTHTSDEVSVRFADIFGTGGVHLVRISSGLVECWPHLGQGVFGAAVFLHDAPRLPQTFDQQRLFLVDIDGSGAADIVYAHDDRVEIWFNQSGSRFSQKATTIALPGACTDGEQVSFADVLGNGTMAMLFSDNRAEPRHWLLDFSSGCKAHLLTQIDNQMGATSTITYAASTKFYLEDKRDGKPWLTRLPFPVQVVEKVETTDALSDTSLVRSYRYRHGYYDGEEREFRGFGMVRRSDAETLSTSVEPTSVPAVITKTWYHNGAAHSADLARLYRPEYYARDVHAAKIDRCLSLQGLEDASRTTIRQAHKALHGRILREEIYSEDVNGAAGSDPYAVTESSYAARLFQNHATGQKEILFVYPAQTFSYHYEGDAQDPRVEQEVMLQVGPYGQVRLACHLFYPRREPYAQYSEQQALQILATLNSFIHVDTLTEDGEASIGGESLYLVGVPDQGRTFEIRGMEPEPGHLYLTPQQVGDGLFEALQLQIGLHETPLSGGPSAQLLSWLRHFYWNCKGSDYGQRFDDALACSWDLHALLHHIEEAAIPDNYLGSGPGEKLDANLLREGRYTLRAAQELAGRQNESEETPTTISYWWKPGRVQNYHGGDYYFLPLRTIDPFRAQTVITYDAYKLVPTEVTDDLDGRVVGEYDYHNLRPCALTDRNNNRSEILFDPLGMVIASAVYGSEDGQRQGDEALSGYVVLDEAGTDPILADPMAYLQGATSYFFYDLFAWKHDRQPVYALNLQRENHVARDLGALPETGLDEAVEQVQIQISYSDGFGRALQTKTRVGEGKALRIDQNGRLLEEQVAQRWLSTGGSVYNNKGQIVRRYEPFYSSTAKYEAEKQLAEYGVSHLIHYDPLLRLVRVDTPDGFFSKAEFTPWERLHYDENDMIEASDFFLANDGRPALDVPIQDALNKAKKHADTPEIHTLDTQGRPFRFSELLEGGDELVTHYERDIQGRLIVSTDPRGNLLFYHDYDLTGAPMFTYSADAGEHWVLFNVMGDLIHTWDGRGFQRSTTYDSLQRPVQVRVQGGDGDEPLDHIVQRMSYGRAQAGDQQQNLCGRLISHYDQAGLLHFEGYDIKGSPRRVTRRLRDDYEQEANWPVDDHDLLADERFSTSWARDALGRVVSEQNPDGSEVRRTYDRQGALQDIEVTFDDGRVERIVDGIERNAKGQRAAIRYGNGVHTTFDYDPLTFQLARLQTVRTGEAKGGCRPSLSLPTLFRGLRAKNGPATTLQDIEFSYDPVGNITCIRDASCETVFSKQQIIEPLMDYSYDALYRLTSATGREHLALTGAENLAVGSKAFRPRRFLSLNDKNQLRKYQECYRYDESGNLIQIQHQTGQSNGSWTRSFSVDDASNRAILTHPFSGSDEFHGQYDAHGNKMMLAQGRDLRWNYRNNIAAAALTKRNDRADDAEYYVYDSSGRRIRKVTERLKVTGRLKEDRVEITETIYLGRVEIRRARWKDECSLTPTSQRWTLQIRDGQSSVAIAHHWDIGRREGQRQIRYQLGNHLGSAALELNDKAQIISYEEYFPYGGTALIAGSDESDVSRKSYRYSGKERDDSTGLYYYGARYYAPWFGRWLSPDPAGTVDGPNLYAFVGGNPIRFVDHFGLFRFFGRRGQGYDRVEDNLLQKKDKSFPERVMIATRHVKNMTKEMQKGKKSRIWRDLRNAGAELAGGVASKFVPGGGALTSVLGDPGPTLAAETKNRSFKEMFKQSAVDKVTNPQESVPGYKLLRHLADAAGKAKSPKAQINQSKLREIEKTQVEVESIVEGLADEKKEYTVVEAIHVRRRRIKLMKTRKVSEIWSKWEEAYAEYDKAATAFSSDILDKGNMPLTAGNASSASEAGGVILTADEHESFEVGVGL